MTTKTKAAARGAATMLATPARARGARKAPARPTAAEETGRRLEALFGEATADAVKQAHAQGLAVPGRIAGKPVEVTPNGRVNPIADKDNWSPSDWKARSRD